MRRSFLLLSPCWTTSSRLLPRPSQLLGVPTKCGSFDLAWMTRKYGQQLLTDDNGRCCLPLESEHSRTRLMTLAAPSQPNTSHPALICTISRWTTSRTNIGYWLPQVACHQVVTVAS
ncbi:hypothetical protein K456DRAFT_283043 [Colletotrichum gloeosporioides 23]|nr:hypothetical protein K456DRAFT_283043 [Colletotrichum gloeosporioides 23]